MFERCTHCGAEVVFGAFKAPAPDGRYYCNRKHWEQQKEFERTLEQARVAYESKLAKLRQDPMNALAKKEALEAGRILAAWKRRIATGDGSVTLFDESALANDLAAATAGASATRDLSVEERLERLTRLHEKGLISEEEFRAKRTQIMDEL